MTTVKHKTVNPAPADLAGTADRLHSAAIHLLRRVRREDAAMGEGPARLSALSVLVFGGPMSLGELAAAEQVKPPTMSRIVVGLEQSKLVQRFADSNDARRIRLCATQKGVKLMKQGRRRRIQYLAHNLRTRSTDELEVVRHAVEILEKILNNWK
jgi:DNA-binding MarR family transcriptional regulator